MKKLLILLPCALLLGACATKNKLQSFRKIPVVYLENTLDCQYLGEVKGVSDEYTYEGELPKEEYDLLNDQAYSRLEDNALALGANRLKPEAATGKRTVFEKDDGEKTRESKISRYGIAYKCKE